MNEIKNMNDETVLYLVHNNADYEFFAILGLFTDKSLAEGFAKAAEGVVEEWPANVPETKWITWDARLSATKNNGGWELKINTSNFKPKTCHTGAQCECNLGCSRSHGEPDDNGLYTHGNAHAEGHSEEEVKKLVTDAFWKKVAELNA